MEIISTIQADDAEGDDGDGEWQADDDDDENLHTLPNILRFCEKEGYYALQLKIALK